MCVIKKLIKTGIAIAAIGAAVSMTTPVLASDIVHVKKTGAWQYINDAGKADNSYTGVTNNANGWWYVKNGKVDFGYNGFAQNENGWWYIENGKVTFKKNGVVRGTVNGETADWNVKGSKVTGKYVPEATLSQKNAVARAKEYLAVMSFSRSELIDQLEYDKFSNADATYGVDHCGANWDTQAKRAAAEYIEILPYSRNELIGQLEHDGFSNAQAVKAVDSLGANWKEQAKRAVGL